MRSFRVTYINRQPTVNGQTNKFEEERKNVVIKKLNLQNSIAFIGIDVNDYASYKDQNEVFITFNF